MENKKRKYAGSGIKMNDNWIKASVCLDDLEPFAFDYKNGKRYVKININIYDQKNQYGKDVSITIDEYMPDKNELTEQKEPERFKTKPNGLPF